MIENSADESWIGRKFYVASDAEADGQTKYPLFDAEGNEIGVLVTIFAAG